MTTIETKDYKIIRNSFWKFWEIDQLEFTLPTTYSDAYEEVEKKLINGTSYSIELKRWVTKDIREQLSIIVSTYSKLVSKSKNLRVNYNTSGFQWSSMNFYLRDGEIYFDFDDAIKREKLLNKLGV